MYHFFRQKVQNVSLKLKIQALILFCVFFLSTVMLVGSVFLLKTYDTTLYRSVSSFLTYSTSVVSERLSQTENLADMVFSDNLIQKRLSSLENCSLRSEQEIYKTDIYNQISNYKNSLNSQTYDYLSYIAIMQGEHILSTRATFTNQLSDEVRQKLIDTAASDPGRTLWVTDYMDTYGIFLVKTIRKIEMLSFEHLGVLVINLDNDKLFASSATPYDVQPLFLLADDDTEIYHSSQLDQTDAEVLRKNAADSYSIFSLPTNGEVFALKGSIPRYDWNYIVAISYRSIIHTIFLVRNIFIAAMILSVLLVLFSSNRILSALTRHFDTLIDKMNRFGEGNYNLSETDDDYMERSDEIGKLHNNFNLMADQINTLIQKNYVSELLKKEAQLKALESQMDPHFLYNTLDSIHWRANAIGAEDIAEITTALGNLLRNTLGKSNTPFTLLQELSLVENYITIQKLRYPQRLQYETDIPECFLSFPLPKFTLQPLVENAIRYGLEEMIDVCVISVNACECRTASGNPALSIKVRNTGSAFDENLLERLETGEVLPHGFGIGLLNIHKRLQITYGDPYGLSLYNDENEETGEVSAIAMVLLPFPDNGSPTSHPEGDLNYVKNVNC